MDKDMFIAVVSAIFASSGFWAFVQSRIAVKDAEKKQDTAERKALLGILHQELKRECKKYIDRGEIHINEYEDLRKYVYEPYRGLGGNGSGEEWMNLVTDLLNHNHKED